MESNDLTTMKDILNHLRSINVDIVNIEDGENVESIDVTDCIDKGKLVFREK